MSTDDILDMIDRAIDDDTSPDAMRVLPVAPEPPAPPRKSQADSFGGREWIFLGYIDEPGFTVTFPDSEDFFAVDQVTMTVSVGCAFFRAFL